MTINIYKNITGKIIDITNSDEVIAPSEGVMSRGGKIYSVKKKILANHQKAKAIFLSFVIGLGTLATVGLIWIPLRFSPYAWAYIKEIPTIVKTERLTRHIFTEIQAQNPPSISEATPIQAPEPEPAPEKPILVPLPPPSATSAASPIPILAPAPASPILPPPPIHIPAAVPSSNPPQVSIEPQKPRVISEHSDQHAAQLLCDASGADVEDLGMTEVMNWWDQTLESFETSSSPINPFVRSIDLKRVRNDLVHIREIHELIASGTEENFKKVISQAEKALKPPNGRFVIPIVYKSEATNQTEALLAIYTRGNDGKLYVKILNRGEGMRLHPLLEERDGKRLYSYVSETMILRDQNLLTTSILAGPSKLGVAWLATLKGFMEQRAIPEEIYAVFKDVLAAPIATKFSLEMASSPQRSATSLHHLPRLLFKDYLVCGGFDPGNDQPNEALLKRLNFAVKARAMADVLELLKLNRRVNPNLIRAEISELHSSAVKLYQQNILDDVDMKRLHELTDLLFEKLSLLQVPAAQEALDLSAPTDAVALNFKAPLPQQIQQRGPWKPYLTAKHIAELGNLKPKASEVLACLRTFSKEMSAPRIAEFHEFIRLLPLPVVDRPDSYWDQLPVEQKTETLKALRELIQSYGSAMTGEQTSELPRSILSLGAALCIADGLARSLPGDPLKLNGFGLNVRLPGTGFFFHKSEQIDRWREVQVYLERRSQDKKSHIFGYLSSPQRWGILDEKDEHLIYLRQFDRYSSTEQLIARRFITYGTVLEGPKLPESYDDLQYFAIALRRLCSVQGEDHSASDLGHILRSDQIPILLRYNDKERVDTHHLFFTNRNFQSKDVEEALRYSKTPSGGRELIQRQLSSYSPEAYRILFDCNQGSENEIMHTSSSLEKLNPGAVHALQKIARLKDPSDYPLRVSELMDFCTMYPVECRNKDIQILIEAVLLQEGSLRNHLDGPLLDQIRSFLEEQRLRTSRSDTAFDDFLLWVRLTIDIEQIVESTDPIHILLKEITASTADLKLSREQAARLALHRAYLYSLKGNDHVNLLRYWIEAHSQCERLSDLNPEWMEGEIQRKIEFEGASALKAIPQSLNELQSVLPGNGPWSLWDKVGDIYTATRGLDRYDVDPIGGRIFCNGSPMGVTGQSIPAKLYENSKTLLKLERTPPLTERADGVWTVDNQPGVLFCKRTEAPKLEVIVTDDWGYTHPHIFNEIDEPWELLPSLNQPCWMDEKGVLVQRTDGTYMYIYEAKNQFTRETSIYYNFIKSDKVTKLQIKNVDRPSDWELKSIKTKILETQKKRLEWVMARDIPIDGQMVRWQHTKQPVGIPKEMLVDHDYLLECVDENPRILLLHKTTKEPKILLTPSENKYTAKLVSSGAVLVNFNEIPSKKLWDRFDDKPDSNLAWAKNGQLQEVIFTNYQGLRFKLNGDRYECVQLPGYFVQYGEAPGLAGLKGHLFLKNKSGEERLILADYTQPNSSNYFICNRNPLSGRWSTPNIKALFYLARCLIDCEQPLQAMRVIDQVGEEKPLTLEDWQALNTITTIKKKSPAVNAAILQLALRITGTRNNADKTLLDPLKKSFWNAVRKSLVKYAQTQNVPASLVVNLEQQKYLSGACGLEEKTSNRNFDSREVSSALYYRDRPNKEFHLPPVCGHFDEEILKRDNLGSFVQLCLSQNEFPAPIDLQLRATIERERLGRFAHRKNTEKVNYDMNDKDIRIQLYFLEALRAGRTACEHVHDSDLRERLQEDVKEEVRVGEQTKWGYFPNKDPRPNQLTSHYDTYNVDAPQRIHTTGIEAKKEPSSISLPDNGYSERPFDELFKACVDFEKKAVPVVEKDVIDTLLPENKDPLCEALQNPLRTALHKEPVREVRFYKSKSNPKEILTGAIEKQKQELEERRKQVESLANSSQTLAQRSGLLSPQHPPLTVHDVLILFNPDSPKALLERNPYLGPNELQELMRLAIDYMECTWKINQLEEAVKELDAGDFTACATILDKKQPFNPHTCWWRSLYQCMSGNILRTDPDQSGLLDKIFMVIAAPASDPGGSQLNQLYFEFQAGGGKTKVLSAIAAMRAISVGKLPVFFSFPNLVDICRRDLQNALSSYFEKRTHYYPYTLASDLTNNDLHTLLDSLKRQLDNKVCVVMVPEGYHLLSLEYHKALSSGDSDRIQTLDSILSFFEEHGVFFVDEGHRNKDSLLNANIAIGEPKGIPSVYRTMQREVYSWLAKQPELALLENGQASLTVEQRTAIIEGLMRHILSLPTLNVLFNDKDQEAFIKKYLMVKETPPPDWLEQLILSPDKNKRLQAQWIAQLRGLATRILPFTLSLKGMIDHGPSIDPNNQVEAPRDHGRVSASKFEVPDIALALTFQGYLQRGLTQPEQFATILRQLQEQADIQREHSGGAPSKIETNFLEWQKGSRIPLKEILANAPDSNNFKIAFESLRKHPEIVLRYVTTGPSGQVSVFKHRLVSSAAGLSYGSSLAIVFSATLGLRGQYTIFGQDPQYSEDIDFLAKVMSKSCLEKNAKIHMDHSSSVEEYVKAHDFSKVSGHLDFGGICGAHPSSSWSKAILENRKEIDGTLFAMQRVVPYGNIGEKVLYLELRGQPPRKLEGSDIKELLRSPELRDKRILKLFGPEDTVGLDLHSDRDALFLITIGENCCLDDLAQALLRLRQYLVDVPENEPSQRVEWVLPKKIAIQIQKALNLAEDADILPKNILQWALINQAARVREALTARAYQEIEAVYMRLLRSALRGKPANEQYEEFKKCVEGVYKKIGYNPFEQWGKGSQQKPTREVLQAFDQQMQKSFQSILKVTPEWAPDRIEKIISETEQLVTTLEEKRGSDLNARQVQKQHVQTQQHQQAINRQLQRQRVNRSQGKGRQESSLADKELSLESLKLPFDRQHVRSSAELFQCELLPAQLLLTRDTLFTQDGSSSEELWKLGTAKPVYHFLVIKTEKDEKSIYLGLSQNQARSYLRQLKGKKIQLGLEVGMIDIQGKWTMPMPHAPAEEEVQMICQSASVLNGRLQHPKYIRKLFEQNPEALEKLWRKLEEIHIEHIPTWEATLANCTAAEDPLQALAQSVNKLGIKTPSRAVVSQRFEWTGRPLQKQQLRPSVPARKISRLALAQLRQQNPEPSSTAMHSITKLK